MGLDLNGMDLDAITPPYFILEFIERIESSIKNNIDLDIEQEVEKLTSFCISDSFIPFFCCELDNKIPFSGIISLYESKEKFLSIKIVLSLFEQLKNKKIDMNNKMKKVIGSSEKERKNIRKNIFKQFFGDIKNKDSFQKFIENIYGKGNTFDTLTNFFKFKEDYYKNNKSYIESLYTVHKFIVYLLYSPERLQIKFDDKNSGVENSKDLEENQNLILENLYKLNSLYNKNEIYQYAIFILNYIKYKKELSTIDKNIENILSKYFKEPFKTKFDKIIWIINDKTKNSNVEILEGKITEQEKFYFNYYIKQEENVNKDIIGIRNIIYKSLFYNNMIRLIKIDAKLLKNKDISIKKIKNDIKLIQDSCPFKNKNLNTYCQIDNKIINLDNSYDSFLQELKKENLDENDKNDDNKKIIENIKINKDIKCQNVNIENNSNISDGIDELKSQLNKERNENKKLIEKISKLEKELKEEKSKNLLAENKIKDLQKNLESQMKKLKDFQKDLDNKKLLNKNLEKESKESFIDTIMAKDKEIRELKLKLSRYPFTLEEGEKLISIIFQSSDQSLHSSIICKNTDKFHKVEEIICEKNPKFIDTENFFYLNGAKINRNKTIEQNGIKDDDIILLKTFDE